MGLALEAAKRALGRSWPNPAVGCVLIKDERVIARGWTQPGGRPHAEACALAAAGTDAAGATAYVTLEPCAHHGQTGPCADALIAAGIATVVVALTDPDPRVAGAGIARLRAAGVTVIEGVRKADAAHLTAGFLTRCRTGRPHLTLKLATTLDGRIATNAGESRWITGPGARRFGHMLRATHDGIVVGAGTVRADDPDLSVRGLGHLPSPVRIVLTSRYDIPTDTRLLRTAAGGGGPVWVYGHGETGAAAAIRDAGGEAISVPAGEDGIDLAAALGDLGTRGLTRVLCDGGGHMAAALLRADLVDTLILMQAGKAIGADGIPAIGTLGLARLAEAPAFTLRSVRTIGADTVAHWQRTTLSD